MTERGPQKESGVESFGERRKQIQEMRLVTQIHSEVEQTRAAMNLPSWVSVKETIDQYATEFEKFFPDIKTRINAACERAKQRGTPLLIVDIAGILDASKIGARTICVTLTDTHLPTIPGRTLVHADILSKQGLRELTETIRTTKNTVGIIFFNPHAGATLYADNPAAQLRIRDVFHALEEFQEPGCDIYGGVRFPITKDAVAETFPDSHVDMVQRDIEPGRPFYAFHAYKSKDAENLADIFIRD